MAEVTVYSTSTCPYCHLLKDHLNSKGVKFKDIVLDVNPGKVAEFQDTCGSMAVPCTHIKGEDGKENIIVGFNKAEIDKVLSL